MDNSEIIKDAEKYLGKKLQCIVPFEHLMFFQDGKVYSCCPAIVNKYTFGNIFDQSYEELWNGEKAKTFRQSVLDGNYQFCDLKSCITRNLKEDGRFNSEKIYDSAEVTELPKMVHFNIDETCNARCIMCRDKSIHNPEWIKKYEENIDKTLIPLLKNAETVYLNGSGELFASNLCKNLVKKITATYPNIKFDLITNGLLANAKNFEEIGLLGKVQSIEVSMHSAHKETYEKIVRGGNFDTLMENLKFISEMKKSGKLDFFWLNFVVNSYNYQEMIDFQKLANELGATTNFWEYRTWGEVELDKRYDEVAIFEPTHPDYPKYLEVINNEIFKSPNCNINAKLRPLSTIS